MSEYIVKNFTAEEIISDKKILEEITELSNTAYLDPKNKAKANYETEGWETKPHTLLHIILKKDRFKEGNGMLSLLYDNNKLIGFAGAYKHTDNILICLVRAFIIKQYRGKNVLANILSHQLTYAKQNNYKCGWLTFNDYNKYLYDMIVRFNKGQVVTLGSKTDNIYKQAIIYKDPIEIQNTMQYVIELPLTDLI
tara:strand:+ start:74 stop:658 length:585 start_codon:yes stop_codon:yes gene_type:complete